MAKNYANEAAEWSYLVKIEELGNNPKTFNFKADEQQRIDMARRFGIVSVESAQASVTLQPIGGGSIHAIGSVSADVTQSCVVSLMPVQTHAEDEFEGWFGDKNKALSFAKAKSDREAKKGQTEIEILEESVDPEPIINGKIDIGELATQYLSLALEPFPKIEGVAYEFGPPESEKGEEGASLRKSPFEALKDWKEKR